VYTFPSKLYPADWDVQSIGCKGCFSLAATATRIIISARPFGNDFLQNDLTCYSKEDTESREMDATDDGRSPPSKITSAPKSESEVAHS